MFLSIHKKNLLFAGFLVLGAVSLLNGQSVTPDITNTEANIWSLLPPLVAIALALITRQTLVSLFAGVWIGAILLTGGVVSGLTSALDTQLVNSLSDPGHAAIVLFSLGFGGIIGVISANGGMQGIVDVAVRYTTNRRRGQLTTAMMGVLVFFDDYANTLLVGNMMRPFTDKLSISREKLSYLVDSTAAPIASLAVISTWSVFQMSLLDGPYQQFGVHENPYITFLRSIPFSFYCLLTLVFVFSTILMRREYGPMLQAEKRVMDTGAVLAPEAKPMTDSSLMNEKEISDKDSHWSNALVPILVVIGITLVGLFVTGRQNLAAGTDGSLREIIGASDSYASLMWGSYIAGFTAILMSVSRRLLSLRDAMDAWINGVRSMILAMAVLILAWSLGRVCEELHTAEYLVNVTEGILTPALFPAITFITAAAISFSTGSSWATMSILVPIIMPMAIELMEMDPNLVVESPIFIATFAAILSGATLGDHCSPISDTTILSSMASGSDHIDHVRTQLPYAVTVGAIALVTGYLIIGFGGSWWLAFGLGLSLTVIAVRSLGRSVRRVPVVSEKSGKQI